MFTHYPVLECLVAFLVIFLLGFLSAKFSGSQDASDAHYVLAVT